MNAMSQKVDDLLRQTSLQESAPAESVVPVVTKEVVDVSIQTDAEKPTPPAYITLPPSKDEVQERMAKVGNFLSDRFMPGVSISDDLCRDMISILTLSTTSSGTSLSNSHILRWLKWAPTNTFADTGRPKDALDFLVLCHSEVAKTSYSAFHGVVHRLAAANVSRKEKQDALATIDTALRTMLPQVKKLEGPNANLAFTALRAMELLLMHSSSLSDRSRLMKLFSEAAVYLRLDQLAQDVLISGLGVYIGNLGRDFNTKSALHWILEQAKKADRVLPPSRRGGLSFVARNESVLVLPTNLVTGKISVHPVCMEIDDCGVFRLIFINYPEHGKRLASNGGSLTRRST